VGKILLGAAIFTKGLGEEMGEVSDAVKGGSDLSKPVYLGKGDPNLTAHFETLADEISQLIMKKDEDVLSEGDDVYAENVRKAALLRAVHSMVVSSKVLLESY
jgi:NTP pyrophosphatase (non-canonical NTP hydrolase)